MTCQQQRQQGSGSGSKSCVLCSYNCALVLRVLPLAYGRTWVVELFALSLYRVNWIGSLSADGSRMCDAMPLAIARTVGVSVCAMRYAAMQRPVPAQHQQRRLASPCAPNSQHASDHFTLSERPAPRGGGDDFCVVLEHVAKRHTH